MTARPASAPTTPWFVPVLNAPAKVMLKLGVPMGFNGLITDPRTNEWPAPDDARGDHRDRRPAVDLVPLGRGPLGPQPPRRRRGDDHGAQAGAGGPRRRAR